VLATLMIGMSRFARFAASEPMPIVDGVDSAFGATSSAADESRRIARSSSSVNDIYREHADRVALWARRLLGPHGDVEDVLQEVFLVVHRRIHEYRGEAKISTWLHEITFRVTQNHRRKLRFTRWLSLTPSVDNAIVETHTPLHALETRRAGELAYRALDKLPESERTALILFEIDGLPADEIAAITGHTVGSVWVQLSRGRKRFREAFARLEQSRSGRDRRWEGP
jgi:RNA polymerase sigma-70 factor (ECF subfamily)